MSKYAENYVDLDDACTEEVMNEIIDLGNDYNKLILKYYKSIKNEAGVKAAAQFYQLEGYFESVIRPQICEVIPIIGEFDLPTVNHFFNQLEYQL
jgi:hypothetical protein